MRRKLLGVLTIALSIGTQACLDRTTGPEDDYDPETHAAHAVATYPSWQTPTLPPLEPKPTYWTCAAPAEGRFVDAAARILVLEARALMTADPYLQAILLAQVAQLKHEAKMALLFSLTECARLYPLPRFFAVVDDNGNIVELRPFTVAAYHGYLVERYLEARS